MPYFYFKYVSAILAVLNVIGLVVFMLWTVLLIVVKKKSFKSNIKTLKT